jgi:hypothetical protein
MWEIMNRQRRFGIKGMIAWLTALLLVRGCAQYSKDQRSEEFKSHRPHASHVMAGRAG